MSRIKWSLDAAYASMLISWLRRLWHCALNSSKSATDSLATEVSVDLLFTLLSPVLSPTRPWSVLAEWSLGVVRPLVDRCPWRTPSLRGLFREDLGVLWVEILRRLVVIFCHPDLVVRVERGTPLSAVSPGDDWLISSAGAAGFSLKVNWVLRESPLPPCIFAMLSWLVLCVHNLLLRRSGYQHVGTVLPMGDTSTTADNLWTNLPLFGVWSIAVSVPTALAHQTRYGCSGSALVFLQWELEPKVKRGSAVSYMLIYMHAFRVGPFDR